MSLNKKYKEAGVDIELGDHCSAIAYASAKRTFHGRKNLIGEPVIMDEGFTGLMDFGDYYLVQNNDTIGSKTQIAYEIGKFDTLGYDLLAMVADDAVCVGAEVISISNTIEINKIDKNIIEPMMKGLEKACLEHHIIIPGGEIAEMNELIKSVLWDATAIGIVEKSKVIDGSLVNPGDKLIGLFSSGFHSNGYSLVRHILKTNYGSDWCHTPYNHNTTWGEICLKPTSIYHSLILEMTGRFKKERKYEVKGIVHITGGGIPGNLYRILKKKNMGALVDNLPQTPEEMLKLQDLHTVKDYEAYQTWNMGIGMILIVENSADIIKFSESKGFNALEIGKITNTKRIDIVSQAFFEKGKTLRYFS